MIATSEIGDEVTSIATAIGLLKEKSPGSFQLQTDFFSSPASHLGAMLSNSEQRDALLRALDGLIPPASPLSLNGSGRRYHPLLEQSDNGQLFLTVAKDSNQADALIELGVAAEAGTEAGPVVTAELPLLTAQGSTVTPIAGTPDGALKLAVRVPLASTGGAIVASLRLVAAPGGGPSTRFVISLETVDAAGKPGPVFEFDPSAAPGGIGQLVAVLLEALLASLDTNVPLAVQKLATI